MEIFESIRDIYRQDVIIKYLNFYTYEMDTCPSHIVSNNVFRVQTGNGSEIVKTGNISKITKEFKALKQLDNILQKYDFIKVPKVFGIYRLKRGAALRMSFEGIHTLEYKITSGKEKEVICIIEKILSFLADSGILWYAVSPKNIMLSEKNKHGREQYCLLDWEHGIKNMENDDKSTYIRAMELREEWISFDREIFPYWSHKWPSFQELLRYNGNRGLMMTLDIQNIASRRIRCLAEICSLPSEITDAAYFRCLSILSTLHNESLGKPQRVIYAADFISENGGTYCRVFCSMLIWVMENIGICDKTELLKNRVLQFGFFFQKKNLVSEKQKKNVLDGLMEAIGDFGSSFLGKQWKEKLVKMCRNYILCGETTDDIDRYKALLWI